METVNRYREGTVVKPYERLDQEQIKLLDRASLQILENPGFFCHNEKAARLFRENGAQVQEQSTADAVHWQVRLPAGLVREAVGHAPSRIVLGARRPGNRLLLDASVPRVYFGTGSEANVWLDVTMADYVRADDPDDRVLLPRFSEQRGSAALLCRAAHLCDRLDHLDFFIRPLNIQDPEITPDTHDVNKFFASLSHITKHVQAGLTALESLDHVVRMAAIIAGGEKALKENPLISFIACVFKSPLQMVDDTAQKVFAIVDTGLPLVISSSPQGGSSAPIQEVGMVAQINAEILAGIALTQLIRPGAPILYGSVPVRARLDDLHDLYGCPEFNQYNVDCVQMARYYGLPCYSTAGVGDAKIPGMQGGVEKLLTHLYMAMSGAQYIHYAFGLLDRTNTFCPLQAVLDNEQIGKVKHCLRAPKVNGPAADEMVRVVRKVMGTSHRLFARHARKAMHSGDVSRPYRFEGKGMHDQVIENALDFMQRLEDLPARHLSREVVEQIYDEIPGLLPSLKQTHPET